MHLESTKEMWDKLVSNYEGKEKVKDFLKILEIVNAMKGLGEKIDEASLVHKILRSLLEIFNPKVSVIEELSDLKTLPID